MSSEHSCVFDSATIVKLCGAWAVAPLDKIATTLAIFYSFLLLCEWFWKKLWRPLFESKGCIKRKARRYDDQPD